MKVWHCPACTYENSLASVVCDICSSPRGLVNSLKTSIAGFAVDSSSINKNEKIIDLSRTESKLMENLRRVEESEALSKWDNIIQYCKEVFSIVNLCG